MEWTCLPFNPAGPYVFHIAIEELNLSWTARTPPNLRFIVDDVSEDWAFPEESFDFIHVRGLAGSLTDWPKFLKRCYKYVKHDRIY